MRHRERARRWCAAAGLAVLMVVGGVHTATAETLDHLNLRGRAQTLHLYGRRGNPPAIVSSGDGGWMHLGPEIAEFLASRGFFVVGFDTKAYLESFTSGATALKPEDVPVDYRTLVNYAATGAPDRPVLVGVSEGAGLSVLAASDAATKAVITGVVALGLPDVNELGWRWKDSLIYVTHGVPNEPTFLVRHVIAGMAPVPLAAIHSTHDEFVPVDLARELVDLAGPASRLWVVDARDHRFSDRRDELGQRLMEAFQWITQNQHR